MVGLARFVLRHRRLVISGWLVLFVIGMFASAKTPDRLEVDFSLPGQQGYETSEQILRIYGNGGPTSNVPTIVVASAPEGEDISQRLNDVEPVIAEIADALPQARIVDYASWRDTGFLTEDERTTFAYIYPKEFENFSDPLPDEAIKPILAAAEADSDLDWSVTGYFSLSQGETEESEEPSLLLDTLIAGIGALAVLLFLFASFLALVPLLIAAVSILTTFTIVLLGTYVMDVSFVVQFLIALIGLGVAIDYSLLLVTRWREERAHGRDNHQAVEIAMRYAGHAVLASAGTVAISLCALLVIPVPLLQSMGLGGLLIPIVSTMVVLTLLPALLGGIGPRVDWPRLRHEERPPRGWSAWARGIVRFRWPAVALATAVLVALIVPIFGIKIGQTRTDALANSGSAFAALQTLRDGGMPAGIVTPMDVLVAGPDADASAERVVEAAEAVPGIASAFAPDRPGWREDGTALVEVIPVAETSTSDDASVVDDLIAGIDEIPGVVGVSGTGPTIQDYIDAVYATFPITLALIALVTFVLLVRTFRSILLPIKALVLNVLSVSATFGATVLFWQEGFGSEQIFDIQATGAVTFWVPLLIFAFLFGLSMDYEVFILARMREEYDKSGHTDTAVIAGLARTGRLVTGAALILFLSFIALAASPGTDIKVMATALGIGILLDATIVRALLVPALVSLFGRWNWWLPAWIARLLRVPAHGATPEVEPGSPGARRVVGAVPGGHHRTETGFIPPGTGPMSGDGVGREVAVGDPTRRPEDPR